MGAAECDPPSHDLGDNRLTAAFCFEVRFEPFNLDIKISGPEGRVPLDAEHISFLHTPGHTPGSISPYMDAGGTRVLFGQDLVRRSSATSTAIYRHGLDRWRGSSR